jgi:hypothetical protein
MRHFALFLAVFLYFAAAKPACADDQQKAEKQVNRISAMATDATARRMVSKSMADALSVPRLQLTQERRSMNLDYGDLFVAHTLVRGGLSLGEIAAKLKTGKTMSQIADDQKGSWKQIAGDAKKLNARIEDNIYKHFLNAKNELADKERDAADNYVTELDVVRADYKVSNEEIAEAQEKYIFWRDLAGELQRKDGKLGTAKEQAAYLDHARASGPQGIPGSTSNHGVNAGASAPPAGGVPPN